MNSCPFLGSRGREGMAGWRRGWATCTGRGGPRELREAQAPEAVWLVGMMGLWGHKLDKEILKVLVTRETNNVR